MVCIVHIIASIGSLRIGVAVISTIESNPQQTVPSHNGQSPCSAAANIVHKCTHAHARSSFHRHFSVCQCNTFLSAETPQICKQKHFEAKNMTYQIQQSVAAVIEPKSGLLTQMGRFVANKRHCVIRWLPQFICLPSTASGCWCCTLPMNAIYARANFGPIRLDCASLALLIFLEMWVKIHSRIAYAGRCQCGYQ